MQSKSSLAPSPLRASLESMGIPVHAAIYRRGANLYSQADTCDSVLYIESGRVRLSVLDPGGKEAVIGLCGPGAFIGEEALAGVATRRVTATAMTRVDVLVVPKALMLRLIRTDVVVKDQFVAHLVARHRALETNLSDQLLHTCEQRLARTLLKLAGYSDQRLGNCPLPEVSQTMIAAMVGTTRSHVNMLMQKFKSLGLITHEDGAVCVTPSLLAFASRPQADTVRQRSQVGRSRRGVTKRRRSDLPLHQSASSFPCPQSNTPGTWAEAP